MSLLNSNIVVKIVNTNNIVVKMSNFGFTTNSESIVLENSSPIKNVNLAIEELTNVRSANEVTGDSLVYDQTTQSWYSKQIDLSTVVGNLDCGTF